MTRLKKIQTALRIEARASQHKATTCIFATSRHTDCTAYAHVELDEKHSVQRHAHVGISATPSARPPHTGLPHRVQREHGRRLVDRRIGAYTSLKHVGSHLSDGRCSMSASVSILFSCLAASSSQSLLLLVLVAF